MTGVWSNGPEGKWTAQLESEVRNVVLALQGLPEQEIEGQVLQPTAIRLRYSRRDSSVIPREVAATVSGESMHRGQRMPAAHVTLIAPRVSDGWPAWVRDLAVLWQPEGW